MFQCITTLSEKGIFPNIQPADAKPLLGSWCMWFIRVTGQSNGSFEDALSFE